MSTNRGQDWRQLHPAQLTAKDWGGRIKQSAAQSHWRMAVESLQLMRTKALRPNQITRNIVAASLRKSWTRSFRILRFPADVVGLNIAVKSCAERVWECGFSLLSFALQQLLRPNIVSYNSLLGIGATGWPRSLSLLVSCGTSADVTSYTSMMSMISPYRWDEGMSLMNRLNSHGLQCDEVLASSLMRLTSWRRGTHLLSSFSSLLLRADVVAVGACSNSCAQSGQWNQAMNFASQLSQMDLKCSLAMINSLLGARNVRWEVAADLFRCFQPDLITVNGAAAACDKAHEWQRAVMLVQQARQFQLQSDSILHSIATDACQRTLKWEAALAGFQACQGVQPCIVLFNTAIAAGTWQLATHFFAGLPQCQMSPSIVTCSATLERLAAGGQWEAAWKLLSTSGMDQPSPSQVWCSAFQGSSAPWEAVLRIYKTMQTLAGQPDATMLAAVADTCEESQRGRPTNLVALCGNVAQEALLLASVH
ncbi:Pentatricopeptide repeat-containing protein At1g63080 [Durusdinium trenchii]|uniref:Mitochondrial n=1 Tax=Durusdinium trenchii TaxID=1381693 RepID=A0ABP0KWR9_9DINO